MGVCSGAGHRRAIVRPVRRDDLRLAGAPPLCRRSSSAVDLCRTGGGCFGKLRPGALGAAMSGCVAATPAVLETILAFLVPLFRSRREPIASLWHARPSPSCRHARRHAGVCRRMGLSFNLPAAFRLPNKQPGIARMVSGASLRYKAGFRAEVVSKPFDIERRAADLMTAPCAGMTRCGGRAEPKHVSRRIIRVTLEAAQRFQPSHRNRRCWNQDRFVTQSARSVAQNAQRRRFRRLRCP